VLPLGPRSDPLRDLMLGSSTLSRVGKRCGSSY
jgi:hypothetical protein